MFREMRRKRQLLPREETVAILEQGSAGTLAVLGDGGYPYAVPLSYVYADGKLYFHSAKGGHKIDAIRACDKASFSVIGQDRIVPEQFTTYFRSAVAFGRVRILEEEGEIRAAAEKLGRKYAPRESEESLQSEINRELPALCILEMTIEHLTGKEAIELVREKGR